MKPSNCDLNELWQGICLRYHDRVPLPWRWYYRMTHRIFAWGVTR